MKLAIYQNMCDDGDSFLFQSSMSNSDIRYFESPLFEENQEVFRSRNSTYIKLITRLEEEI